MDRLNMKMSYYRDININKIRRSYGRLTFVVEILIKDGLYAEMGPCLCLILHR